MRNILKAVLLRNEISMKTISEGQDENIKYGVPG